MDKLDKLINQYVDEFKQKYLTKNNIIISENNLKKLKDKYINLLTPYKKKLINNVEIEDILKKNYLEEIKEIFKNANIKIQELLTKLATVCSCIHCSKYLYNKDTQIFTTKEFTDNDKCLYYSCAIQELIEKLNKEYNEHLDINKTVPDLYYNLSQYEEPINSKIRTVETLINELIDKSNKPILSPINSKIQISNKLINESIKKKHNIRYDIILISIIIAITIIIIIILIFCLFYFLKLYNPNKLLSFIF